MILNDDFVDFIPEMTMLEERISIPMTCWQDNICLSKIWIPSNFLVSRKKASSNWVSKGIFHTLEKRDASQCIKSFSVYFNSDDEEELFLSDSDEDILYSFNTDGKNEKCTEELSRNILPALSDYPSCNTHSKIEITKSLQNSKNEIMQNTYASLNHPDKHGVVKLDENCEILPKSHSASTAISAINSSGGKNKTFLSSKNETSLTTWASLKCSQKFDALVSSKNDSISNKGMNSLTSNWGQLKKTESYVSLNEILDDTPEVSMKDFKCDFVKSKKLTSNPQEKKSEPSQKKSKKKNRAPKSLGLDEFLSDYTKQDYQDDCCEDYFKKLQSNLYKNDNVAVKSIADFPNLALNDVVFVHPEKSKLANSKSSLKFVQEIQGTENENFEEKPTVPAASPITLDQLDHELQANAYKNDNVAIKNKADFPNLALNDVDFVYPEEPKLASSESSLKFLQEIQRTENENVDEKPTMTAASPITVYTLEKIVIENIPKELSEEDIHSLIDGYGETVHFSLQQDGKFLKAFVQINLSDSCDIDWIVECLDGSEPFGALTGPLKCYRDPS